MFDPFPMMFHPTLIVDDLDEAASWFRRVFGRREVRWEDKFDLSLLNPEYPINYSYFFVLGDVSLDVLSPSLMASLSNSAAVYSATEGLNDIAWYTSDIGGIAQQLEAASFNTRDQAGNKISDGDVPPSPLVHDNPMIWTYPEETGLTYEFYTMGRRHWPLYSKHADPRLDPSWQPGIVNPDDPLGIITSSWHTIHTADQARARRLYVDVLGGEVIAEGVSERCDAQVTLISYARSVLRFVTPRASEPSGSDHYTGITFQVQDLQRAQQHLSAEGLTLETHPAGISTVAAECYGASWSFTDRTLGELGLDGLGK